MGGNALLIVPKGAVAKTPPTSKMQRSVPNKFASSYVIVLVRLWMCTQALGGNSFLIAPRGRRKGQRTTQEPKRNPTSQRMLRLRLCLCLLSCICARSGIMAVDVETASGAQFLADCPKGWFLRFSNWFGGPPWDAFRRNSCFGLDVCACTLGCEAGFLPGGARSLGAGLGHNDSRLGCDATRRCYRINLITDNLICKNVTFVA